MKILHAYITAFIVKFPLKVGIVILLSAFTHYVWAAGVVLSLQKLE